MLKCDAEGLEKAVEIVVSIIFNRDEALVFAVLDPHFCPEFLAEGTLDLLNEIGHRGIELQFGGFCPRGSLGGLFEFRDEDFGLPDAQSVFEDFFTRVFLQSGIVQTQEHFGMTDRQRPGGDMVPHFLRQRQEAQGICDRRAAFADTQADILLAQVENIDQSLISLRLFNRVEILTLNILNERQLRQVRVIGLTDNGANGFRAEGFARTEAAFPGNQLIAIAAATKNNRLNDPMGFDGCGQFGNFIILKHPAGLKAIGLNLRNVDLMNFFTRRNVRNQGGRSAGDGFFDGGRNERAQSFAECWFCHKSAILLVLTLQVNVPVSELLRFSMSKNPPPPEQIAQAVTLLRQGQVVAMPTETVYGLAGDAANPESLARIFAVKNRPEFDPLILHAPTLEKAWEAVTEMPEMAKRLAETFWPGPLTLVLPKAEWVPDLATASLPTVALRVPAHPVARDLLEAFGGFLAAPSANPFGRLSPTTAEAVREGLGEAVPMILDGGPCEKGLESTIIGFDGEARAICLRLGALTLEQIAQVAGREIPVPGRFDPRLAPGNLPKHYAPRTRVRIFEGEPPLSTPAQMALVSFTRRWDISCQAQFVLSETGDLEEAAARFFQTLRDCDKLAVDEILVERFPDTGLGRALNDRLQKAANSFES